MVRAGAPWRLLPTNFPPWPTVYQQARRWVAAGCFEARVLQSSPESGARAGYNGHKRRKGSTIHQAVDTLGSLLALTVSPANADERTQVAALAAHVQAVPGDQVELAWGDAGYMGDAAAEAAAAQAAAAHGIHLEVVRLPEAKRGFVLLPRRWVAERRFGWVSRFRRLARDYERRPAVLTGLHFLAFACLLLHQVIPAISSS